MPPGNRPNRRPNRNQNKNQGRANKNQNRNKGPGSGKERLPGVPGKDYQIIRNRGRLYAMYAVNIPGGKTIRMIWRVNNADALNVNNQKVRPVADRDFQNMQFFGDASEILTAPEEDKHPFKTWIDNLAEAHGPVGWIKDPEVMGIMLMGWAEQKPEDWIMTRLQRTKYYQGKTEWENKWGGNQLSESTKANTIDRVRNRVMEAIEEDIYGAGFDHTKFITPEKIDKVVNEIASGKWGDPDEGFDLWLSQELQKAQDIEGTTAWMMQQSQAAEQRAFANKPEDEFQRLKNESAEWVGSRFAPADDVLRQWANDLVTGVASDADWEQYIQARSKALYPWLSPNERWQDRAGAYKNLVEQDWGTTVAWDDPILSGLGANDANGAPTGGILSLDQYRQHIRKDPRFWKSQTAHREAADVVSYLEGVFG